VTCTKDKKNLRNNNISTLREGGNDRGNGGKVLGVDDGLLGAQEASNILLQVDMDV
jgi:hypothetical protein